MSAADGPSGGKRTREGGRPADVSQAVRATPEACVGRNSHRLYAFFTPYAHLYAPFF